jgi:hypothetical protein
VSLSHTPALSSQRDDDVLLDIEYDAADGDDARVIEIARTGVKREGVSALLVQASVQFFKRHSARWQTSVDGVEVCAAMCSAGVVHTVVIARVVFKSFLTERAGTICSTRASTHRFVCRDFDYDCYQCRPYSQISAD